MSDACAVVSRGESKSVPRWCHHGPLRLTAALVALAMLAFAAPASAGPDIWRATIVVKDNPNDADQIGFGTGFPNSTATPGNTFPAGGKNYTVITLANERGAGRALLNFLDPPTASEADGWTLHIGARSIPFSSLTQAGNGWQWNDSSLWSSGNTLFVADASLSVGISTNVAPTSSPGTVNVTEDMVYTFAASDFSFSDADTGDTLSSVKVETLPAPRLAHALGRRGERELDTVPRAQLDNGLKYAPASDGYGVPMNNFLYAMLLASV